MFDIQTYTDYISRIADTSIGKIVYSIAAGALGVVILAVFFAGFLSTAALDKAMPFIVGFNAVLTGYMVVDKIRITAKHRRLLPAVSGAVMALLAAVGLNILFYQWAGYLFVGIGSLVLHLVIGILAGALGGKLCAKYLAL